MIHTKIRKKMRHLLLKRDRKRFEKEYYKKSVLSYPPRYITIGVGSACTFKCLYCAYHSDDAKDGMSNVYNLNFKLSINDFKRMIDICYRGRVPRVHLCGTGEPFLYTDFLEMIDYTINVYGYVSLQTDFHQKVFEKNNYLDEILKRKENISYITTDILSGDKKTHESIKIGSSYDYLLSSMEYISKNSNILLDIHVILTKHNYEHLDILIEDLASRKIKSRVSIANLHAYDFNEFTSPDSLYTHNDLHITESLQKVKEIGDKKGINVSIPEYSDKREGKCGSFWGRFQTWPVKGIDKDRYGENIIIGGCNAVVRGNLKSLGYFFDYDNIMDLWNNEHFVTIRKGLLEGVYPDEWCYTCKAERED